MIILRKGLLNIQNNNNKIFKKDVNNWINKLIQFSKKLNK
jgi:hypothetical protein